ncbi:MULTISPECIES: TetR/AcrR family transcriptional regulator [Streptomyces]|uniref:DNA-binding transcriptional regulator EnvR n=1 Tax=Streptomyces chartreusis NRRL 3882 TaxID=1079985 RepID=A0A2N9B0A2_STRCX|nr:MULTISPECIES: TetR/AcrR family transcriptional regulator [Streptomyces]MYS91047.1 TetR family transcriptional regulator [Streptomyces sp. SID5464]SOR76743.1 DNA-binding transcriptional regulator EnvR [Streptomyces chartreusis NRRL 3882]
MPAQSPRKAAAKPLRSDARHNREKILEAAHAAFTTQGIDAPLTAIARRAGVGPATLYRHFPTRDALVTEVFAEQVAACVAVLDEALADPDPWRGFCSVVEKVCAMQAADRGFTAAFLSRFPDAVGYERERSRAEQGLAELVRRAQEAGKLRADFHPADITLLMLANSGVIDGVTKDVTAGPPQLAAAASRRLVGYLLQSFPAGGSTPLPPAVPLGLEQIHQV